MVKTNENEKMTEDVLQDQTVAPAAAEPATNQEVADASVDAGMDPNAMTAEGETPAEDPNMAATPEAAAQPETFTAPVAGMVPSGWINPSELAQAVAQETGDVQAAETAPDVQTAEDPNAVAAAPQDANVSGEQPLVADANQNVQPQLESLKFSNEEIEMILEYRKYKANKLVEEVTPSEAVHAEDENEDTAASGEDVVSAEPAPLAESEEVCPECGKEECECEDKKITESEEELDEVVDEEPVEDVEEFEVDEDDVESHETDDLLSRINAFLDDDSEEGETATEAFEMTADYLDSLFAEEDEDFDDSEDEDFDDEDIEEGSEEFDVVDEDDLESEPSEEDFVDDEADEVYEDDEDFEESTKVSDDRLTEDIIYPKGSAPTRKPSVEAFEDADNLVEAYKRESARKREALNSYRDALSGSSRVKENRNSDSNAWSNNRFEEKYNEHSKFDYRDLLNNGFLG